MIVLAHNPRNVNERSWLVLVLVNRILGQNFPSSKMLHTGMTIFVNIASVIDEAFLLSLIFEMII